MRENNVRYITRKNLVDEGKIIYVVSVPGDKTHQGWLKIGDTSEPTLEMNNHKNSEDLRKYAYNCIQKYMNRSGLPNFRIEWAELAFSEQSGEFFRDYDVHEVLRRSHFERGLNLPGYYNPGNEWFKLDVNDAKRAIKAVKDGRSYIDHDNNTQNKVMTSPQIIFRPEQKKFINKTVKHYHKRNKDSKTMLWNAKMRFGKTLCALEVTKRMNFRNTLIITHRPEVNTGWCHEFNKLLRKTGKYAYGSRDYYNKLSNLKRSGKKYFYFASLQDLTGSTEANGKYKKDEGIFHTRWDFLIIDEAHEGTQTSRAQAVMNNLSFKHSLLLSGTPFNIMNKYKPDQICTWDYIDEQSHKAKWVHDPKHPEHTRINNPYGTLPKVPAVLV